MPSPGPRRSHGPEIDVRWHEALARATRNRLRIGIALGIHEAVMRRHNWSVQPDHVDEQVITIPDDLAGSPARWSRGQGTPRAG